MSEKIILGIDPGTTVMGYGLIKVVNNQMKFLLLNELDNPTIQKSVMRKSLELLKVRGTCSGIVAANSVINFLETRKH